MAAKLPRETDLYQPVKALLEAQGYEVKGEVGKVDVMACRGEEQPLIVELKTSFSLQLVHQAIERQSITDIVYIAIPRLTGKVFLKNLRKNIALCKRIGIGLITVRLSDNFTEIHNDPAPYKPRKNAKKKTRLLREFSKRVGDPNIGGTNRQVLMTAYKQDALRCLKVLATKGATKASEVAKLSGVERARNIMADNHYAWFEKVERGIYGLAPKGELALEDYKSELAKL